jgi:Putative metallopeptidase
MFAGYPTPAMERRFRRLCVRLGYPGHVVLPPRRLRARRSQRQGEGHYRLSGGGHPAGESRCNKENQGRRCLRTHGGPPNQGNGVTHDLQIIVTDKLPKAIDCPTTELDGRTILWPAAFSKATHDVLTESLPEVIATKGLPRAISQENFTADVLNVWGNQFILGHELGHAIMHQLSLPLTGLEEDSADGFATFFTINDKETGPNAALGAAVLFDAMGSKRPNLTLEDFSSDHAVILQRVYNFLCAVVGSDPQRLENSLVTDGYIPDLRAMLCPKEWTQLNYGWWTMLEPHLADSYKQEAEAARQQARKGLEDENKALAAKLRQMRGQQ